MCDVRRINKELLPCPFCGDRASLAWYNNSEEHVVVECENLFCGSAVCGAKTPEEAKQRWNNRVSLSELKPCPFCGHNAHLEHFAGEECEMFQVKCGNPQCQAETVLSAYATEVRATWNNRNGGNVIYD
ncbi:MAG: Lar family restriction alleviation protein [Synergistaceae bacterium]|nr:Lar family restriction alleviation protein [Synergistaceae bacterium]